MLFSRKENIFMCLVAFQKMFRKIFSNVWLCSWKYHVKHIFYLLLTFSHIFSVTKRIHNIIHSSKHKQNPKKNHQIQTNIGEIAIVIGEIAISIHDRDRDRDRHRSARCLDRSLSLSLAAFVRWVCFVVFWLSVFLSFARATEIVWR